MESEVPVWLEPAGLAAPHPLAGLAHALKLADETCVLLSLDLPLLPPAVLAGLARHPAPLAVLGWAGRPAALVIRAGSEHAEALAAAALAGQPTLRTLLELGAVVVDLTDLDPTAGEDALLNVNDEAARVRAEQLVQRPT